MYVQSISSLTERYGTAIQMVTVTDNYKVTTQHKDNYLLLPQ